MNRFIEDTTMDDSVEFPLRANQSPSGLMFEGNERETGSVVIHERTTKKGSVRSVRATFHDPRVMTNNQWKYREDVGLDSAALAGAYSDLLLFGHLADFGYTAPQTRIRQRPWCFCGFGQKRASGHVSTGVESDY